MKKRYHWILWIISLLTVLTVNAEQDKSKVNKVASHLPQVQKSLNLAQKVREFENNLQKTMIVVNKGPIKATFNGQGEIKSLKIAPAFMEKKNANALENLIMIVVREGFEKAQKIRKEKWMKFFSINNHKK